MKHELDIKNTAIKIAELAKSLYEPPPTDILDYIKSKENVNVYDNLVCRHPVRGAIPLNFYGYQQRFLNNLEYSDYTIINSSRQMGVTLTTLAYVFNKSAFIQTIRH